MSQSDIVSRLAALRQQMQAEGVHVIIVPSADPHMSEYLPDHWQARRHFSGFAGSVGTLVVGMDFAHLWADARYWVQAEKQLNGTGIVLQKVLPNQPTYGEVLAELPADSCVAIDGMVLSVGEYERLSALFTKNNIKLVLTDIVSKVWQDRPAMPQANIYCHDQAFVDQSSADKLAKIRQKMHEKQADYHLISSLDDIAWLTNLRGQDVPCNPVFLAHLLISQDQAMLYVDTAKLDDKVRLQLDRAAILVADYQALSADLAKLTGVLWIDKAKVAKGLLEQLPAAVEFVYDINPSTLLKAVKSPQDIAHIREAMAQDGAALCEFFADLEARLAQGETVTEVDIDRLLTQARQRQAHYISPSFDTIAGFAGNGAIVHYKAEVPTCKTLVGDGLLLIDSGAQYQNGTTDITRMMGVGQVCDDAKRDVTYVLKAHIALARAVFPAHIPTPLLDMIARAPMWAAKLNYGHGTGHGVGYFLNVHEGPQVIAYNTPLTDAKVMQLGMITSNEPGLYRTDKWGVRIENLVATVSVGDGDFGEFWAFETLTLCPIDTRIILPELLTDDEKAWLNSYHKTVHDKLIERVSGSAKAWLIERTCAI